MAIAASLEFGEGYFKAETSRERFKGNIAKLIIERLQEGPANIHQICSDQKLFYKRKSVRGNSNSKARIGSLELDLGNTFRTLRALEKKGVIGSVKVHYTNSAGYLGQLRIYHLTLLPHENPDNSIGYEDGISQMNIASVVGDCNRRQAKFLHYEKCLSVAINRSSKFES